MQIFIENCCVKMFLPFPNGITVLHYFTVLCRYIFHFVYVVTVLLYYMRMLFSKLLHYYAIMQFYYMSMFFAELLCYYLITLLHDSFLYIVTLLHCYVFLQFCKGITILRYYTFLCRCVFHFVYVVMVLCYYMSMFFTKLSHYPITL